jgi:hypothetical protein
MSVIVDPDFLEHWRTQLLIDGLDGDAMAPIYVLRIWAHCQNRRATRFDMTAPGLKALCRYAGAAERFESAMIQAGFVVRDGDAIEVPKWADHNSKLVSNWKNGKLGGRPNKTHEKPNDNPSGYSDETQQEPINNPSVTNPEPIREEKRRTKEGADAPSSIWSEFIPFLVDRGDTEKNARTFIGSLLRDWEEPDVSDALRAGMSAKGDAKAYARKVLAGRPKKVRLPEGADGVLADLRGRFGDAVKLRSDGKFYDPPSGRVWRLNGEQLPSA